MQNIEAYFKKITIVHLHIINSQRFVITFYMVCKQARLYREKMRGGRGLLEMGIFYFDGGF